MSRNANSRFSELPAVDIQRSKFFRPFQHKTTFNAGELVPIFCDEVLPGDTFTLDTSVLVRMTTPIFPVMDNAYLDTYFFFVPNRLVWDHWKELNGENNTSYWTQPTEYVVPQVKFPDGNSGILIPGFQQGSVADYFGLPTEVAVNDSVSALPFRAYVKIWNDWFRDQNTMAPAFCPTDDNDRMGLRKQDVISAGIDLTFSEKVNSAYLGAYLLPVAKYRDYFSSCLPAPQKGPSVSLPLYDDLIPVKTLSDTHNLNSVGMSFDVNHPGSLDYNGNFLVGGTSVNNKATLSPAYFDDSNDQLDSAFGLAPNNLYADVSNVAVATINQLRQAFQIQKLYERDARGGTRYIELLKSHFGVDSPDGRLQRSEYLGGKRIPINVDQVLQTSSTDATSPQGNTSAYSLTSDQSSTFTKSFTEHGFIIGVCCVRTDHTYQQGIEKMWSRKRRFDYYWPALANIGEQPVLRKEIFAVSEDGIDFAPGTNDSVFGYQEAWADYRYKPSRVSGLFRSNASGTLDAWHYADYYSVLDGSAQQFGLNADWLSETPKNIQRTLAVQDEDQFIADFYLHLECVRPMPLYSVPGLVDHH